MAGYLFAYDAKSGELLWKFNTGGGERGRRGGDLILSFALPTRSR